MGPQKRVAFDGVALLRWPALLFELAGLHLQTWVASFDRKYLFYRILLYARSTQQKKSITHKDHNVAPIGIEPIMILRLPTVAPSFTS